MNDSKFLFFYANIIKYDYLDESTKGLVLDPNYKEDELHLVLFVDGMLFDLQNKERVYLLDLSEGYVNQPIYTNVGYFEHLYEDENVTENKIKIAKDFYEEYLKQEKLVKEKKLLRFTGRRIY